MGAIQAGNGGFVSGFAALNEQRMELELR